MRENMRNLAKYAEHICGIYASYHMPHICGIFFRIFLAYEICGIDACNGALYFAIISFAYIL